MEHGESEHAFELHDTNSSHALPTITIYNSSCAIPYENSWCHVPEPSQASGIYPPQSVDVCPEPKSNEEEEAGNAQNSLHVYNQYEPNANQNLEDGWTSTSMPFSNTSQQLHELPNDGGCVPVIHTPNGTYAFTLYQKQAQIYSNLFPSTSSTFDTTTIPSPWSIPPPEQQQQQFLNQQHTNHVMYQTAPYQGQLVGEPYPQMYGQFPPPSSTSIEMDPSSYTLESDNGNSEEELPIRLPSWARLNYDAEENALVYPLATASGYVAHPRLVEYIGDQYHEKNPHTRRTILLNQRRLSENDPIVFYRFYQFSCPCMGKVWFSPLHRARHGCYCRDCHQFLRPFGHIDGLTPYMGQEMCYAKFQCHNCGRNWSCQKSRSNFPDNCFACGTMVYPYYQVAHSVLRKKIVNQADNCGPTILPTYPSSNGNSLLQQVFRKALRYAQSDLSVSQQSVEVLLSKRLLETKVSSAIDLLSTFINSEAKTPQDMLGRRKLKNSVSDTFLLRRWRRSRTSSTTANALT